MAVAKKQIEDLQSNVAEIKEMLNETVAAGSAVATDGEPVITMEAARERLRALGEKTRDYVATGRDQLTEAQATATKQVKKRPLLSIGAAFAAGAVISGLITRR